MSFYRHLLDDAQRIFANCSLEINIYMFKDVSFISTLTTMEHHKGVIDTHDVIT